jgi:hypothetical protein
MEVATPNSLLPSSCAKEMQPVYRRGRTVILHYDLFLV